MIAKPNNNARRSTRTVPVLGALALIPVTVLILSGCMSRIATEPGSTPVAAAATPEPTPTSAAPIAPTVGELGRDAQRHRVTSRTDRMGSIMKTHANALARYNMTANAIESGFSMTETRRPIAEQMLATLETDPKIATKEIAAGRPGEPEDVAATASFFYSEELRFTSCEVLHVTGRPTL